MIMELRDPMKELSRLAMVEFFKSNFDSHRTYGLGRRGCDGITHTHTLTDSSEINIEVFLFPKIPKEILQGPTGF